METYLIPCLLGLEKLVSDEVKRLGLQEVQAENGRILCRGTLADAARLNLNLRCGARVLLVLGRFPARSFEELFQGTRAIAWEDYLPENSAFPVKGYSISSPWEKIGYRGSEVYDIFLDDVKVTEDQILGKPGDGFTQLLGTTAYGKLGFTAVFVGTALGAADIALKYCQEKLHRGKSITKFPTTQLRLSTMLTYAHTAELLLLEAADYCDHNHFAGDDIPTMRAVQARTAQAKGYAAETATKVATMAVNAMGAYGVCDEYQAERFLRDAAVAPNIEGSGDIQYLIHGMYVAANGNTN